MKNPLNRRLLRELKGEFGKYLVILILLIATIGLVSGFLVADGSMPGNITNCQKMTLKKKRCPMI